MHLWKGSLSNRRECKHTEIAGNFLDTDEC